MKTETKAQRERAEMLGEWKTAMELLEDACRSSSNHGTLCFHVAQTVKFMTDLWWGWQEEDE